MQFRPRCPQVDIKIERRPQTDTRPFQRYICVPGAPLDTQLAIFQLKCCADDAHPVEISKAAFCLCGSGELVQQQRQDVAASTGNRFRGSSWFCGRGAHIELEGARRVPDQTDAGADDLQARRCDFPFCQGAGAQGYRYFANAGNRSHGIFFDKLDAQCADVQRTFPARPGEDEVVQFSPKAGILALQQILRVGHQKLDRYRTLRQPPGRPGDKQPQHQQNAA